MGWAESLKGLANDRKRTTHPGNLINLPKLSFQGQEHPQDTIGFLQ